MHHLPTQEKVLQITIVPRGRSLGATWHLPADDSSNMTRNQMYEELVGLLGGRVAEALFVGDITVGASNDIDRASKLARDIVARYGMCEKLGTVSYLSDNEVFLGRDYEKTKSYSEKVAATIDDEVKVLIDAAYDHCAKLLKENEGKVMAVVEFLLERETMTAAQFEACMKGEPIPDDDTDTILFDGIEKE
jgi:cell division protease FtsH